MILSFSFGKGVGDLNLPAFNDKFCKIVVKAFVQRTIAEATGRKLQYPLLRKEVGWQQN